MKKSKISELYKDCSAIITEKTQEIHRLILGYGDCDAKVMIVSETPSTKEEELGIPFVGKSGKDLEGLINMLGLTTDDVYITNFVKYRPYKVNERSGRIINRVPTQEEIEFFLPYIEKEIEIVDPKIIITLGDDVLKGLMADEELSINKEHGKVRMKTINNQGYRLFPIAHQSTFISQDTDDKKRELDTLITLIEHASSVEKEDKPIEGLKIEPKKVVKATKKRKKEVATKKQSGHKIIMVYGGSGYADDPTLVAVDRVSSVLNELEISIIRLDLHKKDYDIEHFFNELKGASAVVIATTVEWIGISGRLQEFLDKCYFYGDKALFEGIILMSIAISKQGYERDANNHLIKCWELLGGVEGSSILACINKASVLETNLGLLNTIDKKTEEFFRAINQNRKPLPTSIRSNKIIVEVPTTVREIEDEEINGTESGNHLVGHKDPKKSSNSLITNYDEYIEKQQRDIDDISDLFKQKMRSANDFNNFNTFQTRDEVKAFQGAFVGATGELKCIIQWRIEDKRSKNIVMEINSSKINTYYGDIETYNLIMTLDYGLLEKIIEGKVTIQRAFMTGEVKAQGDFSLIYKLDSMFEFK